MSRMFVKSTEIGITKEDLVSALNYWLRSKAYYDSYRNRNEDRVCDVTLHPNNKYIARLKLNSDL